MKVRRQPDPQLVWRNARRVGRANVLFSGIMFAFAAYWAVRGKGAQLAGSVGLGAFYALLASVAFWRMRRARERAHGVELFPGQ